MTACTIAATALMTTCDALAANSEQIGILLVGIGFVLVVWLLRALGRL